MTPRKSLRSGERGAALFIVVLVTVLLGAIGVFAVQTASLVERAAGFSRKGAEAAYLSELGLRSVAADMAGKEKQYSDIIAAGAERCWTSQDLAPLLPPGVKPSCRVRRVEEIQAELDPSLGLSAFMGTDPAGFIGAIARPGQELGMAGVYWVELVDLGPAPNLKAGTDLSEDKFSHKQVTVTAIGQVQPVIGGVGTCSDAVVQGSAVQAVRAHITFMPQN
jgi:hypothetical protein